MDIYVGMQSLVRDKRSEMWHSIERDLTPEQQIQMNNLIKQKVQYSKDKAKYVDLGDK